MRDPRLFDAADRHDLDDGALETNDSSKGVLEADDDVGGPVPASRVFPVFPAAASAEAARGVSVVQLNADDGGGGSAARVASIEAWLRDMPSEEAEAATAPKPRVVGRTPPWRWGCAS